MFKNTHYILILIVILAALIACSGGDSSSNLDTSRCEPASTAQVEVIQNSVQNVQASNYIGSAFYVKSNDYENVRFVAAKLYGPGMEEGVGPGLWAMGGSVDIPGTILSVNGFAKEFTNYPDASTTDYNVSQFDDGAQEAINCAK